MAKSISNSLEGLVELQRLVNAGVDQSLRARPADAGAVNHGLMRLSEIPMTNQRKAAAALGSIPWGEVAQDVMPVWGDIRAVREGINKLSNLPQAEDVLTPEQAANFPARRNQQIKSALFDFATVAPGLGALGEAAKHYGRAIDSVPSRFGQSGMIAGPNAKTADLPKLERAQEMKAAGASADDIYQETSWWLGHPDGVPRFEIDDSSAAFNTPPEGTLRPLDNALRHDKLISAYPDMRSIAVKTENMGRASGAYNKNAMTNTERLEINPRKAGGETYLHELQHALQGREGMAAGGSPGQFISDLSNRKKELDAKISRANKRMSEIVRAKEVVAGEAPGKYSASALAKAAKHLDDEYDKLMGLRRNYAAEALAIEGRDGAGIQETAFNKYKRLAGESEARLVEQRLPMDATSRMKRPFFYEYDVPIDEQIISPPSKGL